MIYVRLMFMLGSHVDRDPLHPWAAAILQVDSAADPVSKARRLDEAAMERIEQAFKIARSTGEHIVWEEESGFVISANGKGKPTMPQCIAKHTLRC